MRAILIGRNILLGFLYKFNIANLFVNWLLMSLIIVDLLAMLLLLYEHMHVGFGLLVVLLMVL